MRPFSARLFCSRDAPCSRGMTAPVPICYSAKPKRAMRYHQQLDRRRRAGRDLREGAFVCRASSTLNRRAIQRARDRNGDLFLSNGRQGPSRRRAVGGQGGGLPGTREVHRRAHRIRLQLPTAGAGWTGAGERHRGGLRPYIGREAGYEEGRRPALFVGLYAPKDAPDWCRGRDNIEQF